jgi:hypothetical protein
VASVPALGQAVDDLDVLMAGEAEVDEPLAVEQPRRLLQQRNPPSVVLDQVVVGGEDGDDYSLLIRPGNAHLEPMEDLAVDAGNRRFFGLIVAQRVP